MKITFLYILLFSSLAFSQKIPNLTSISLHKIYNEPADSGCNSFIDKQNAQILSWKISDCDNLVLELIKLKQSLKNRKSIVCSCQLGCIGCPSIEYMITYQFNKLVDTIYFNNNKYEKSIIDYKNKKEYPDTNNEILKIIHKDKTLEELFETDIDKIFYETLSVSTRDSIAKEEIKIKDKSIYGLNIDEMDKVVDLFYTCKKEYNRDLYNHDVTWKIDSDYTVYNKNMKSYYFNEDKLINRVIIEDGNYASDPESLINELMIILGIHVGDDEAKLSDKFPNSTKHLEAMKKYFKDEKGDYWVTVNIPDYKGNITFVLNNSKVIQIEINFRYPRN